MPSQILGWDNTGRSGLKKTDLDTEVLDHHSALRPLPIPPSCDRADLVQLLAPGSAQVIWWTQQPQHLQKKMRQRWRNLTDITPVTRIKEFHDGENVKWGRSTVRDDWLMCIYTKSDDFLENVQILLQRAPTMWCKRGRAFSRPGLWWIILYCALRHFSAFPIALHRVYYTRTTSYIFVCTSYLKAMD